jgi:DNA replication protein DnaC
MRAHELQTKLKTLKLGGMLQTLEMRRAQAEDQRLGHIEFLALLLDDEIDRRQSKMLAQRLHRARFEEMKTLEEFDWSFNPQVPAEQLRNLATCGFLERRESVLFCGPVGVGKTHVAQSLGHAACRYGASVLFTKTSAMLRDLAGGRADGSWEPRLRRYLQNDVLILDDFGMREFTPTQAEDLYELICAKFRTGSMIVTSNRAPTDWYALFPQRRPRRERPRPLGQQRAPRLLQGPHVPPAAASRRRRVGSTPRWRVRIAPARPSGRMACC